MRSNSRFTRNAGCFACECCGRKTRHTGENDGTMLCPECYEAGGIENGLSDGAYQGQDRLDAERRVAELHAIVEAKKRRSEEASIPRRARMIR